MPTRREEQHRIERELGVPVRTPTHPKRGFLKRVNDAATSKAIQRHHKNEVRKKGGVRK